MDQSFDPHVIDHYEDPYQRGPLEGATHAAEAAIPGCEDRVRIELTLSAGGEILQAGFDGQGCLVSQASASMLAEKIEGMSVDQLREFSAAEMLALFGAELPTSRQKCCLLPWRVMQRALDQPLVDELDEPGASFGGPSLGEEC